MSPAGGGEAFAVVPIKNQAGSLEWEQYASLVAQQLTEKGYVRVPLARLLDAKYAVLFSYAIDRGKTAVSSVPVFGQTGRGYYDILFRLKWGLRTGLHPAYLWGNWRGASLKHCILARP
jgi:hypothetical protein